MSFTACNEEEVQVYSSELGINFLAPNGYGGFTDDYTNLSTTYNFYTSYLTQGMDIKNANIQLGIQLEGIPSEQSVNIRLKATTKEGYEPAEIILPNDSIINPGEYRRTITVECVKPQTFDTEYRTIITFDYEHSDVVAGTKERQQYELIIKDETDWSSMNVDNEKEWNSRYASTLGNYGPMKVRFIMAVMGEQFNASYETLSMLYSYTYTYPTFGFRRYISTLKDALQEYNDSHEIPLTEPDGTLVSF